MAQFLTAFDTQSSLLLNDFEKERVGGQAALIQLNILVEGQTEEGFVWQILQLHLSTISLNPVVVETNQKPGGRGGNTNRTFAYGERDLRRLLARCEESCYLRWYAPV